nr:NADH-quinone oxidoreductase subunit K [Spirochaeta isovalerica]
MAFVVMAIGLWGILSRRHLIRMIIGFSILDTGIHILLVAIGYRKGGTAPILDEALSKGEALMNAVDPVPSALVLTAIVIGLAVTALMLSFAVRMVQNNPTMNADEHKELKW